MLGIVFTFEAQLCVQTLVEDGAAGQVVVEGLLQGRGGERGEVLMEARG